MSRFRLSDKRRAVFEKMLEQRPGPSRPETIPRRPAGAPCPLSFAQRRLWFLNQLSPQSPFYNIFAAIPLETELDARVLGRSLGEIVRRHESLRTTFVVLEGEPVQVIAPEMEIVPRFVDLSKVPSREQEDTYERMAGEEARAPFDLARGPLIRATLVRRGVRSQALWLALHHIVCDGWSLGILAKELEAFLVATLSGGTAELPALPIQYGDFAAWQQRWLTGELERAQTDYWIRQLTGVPALELPADRPRPRVASYRGGHLDVRFPKDHSEGLQALCHQESATPFMVVLAAFAAFLHRYTGQTDITVGTPTSGRTRTEIEYLIGFFVNTLVVRIQLSGAMTFRDLARRVRATALDAYSNQDLPFERIVEEVQPQRDLARNPLFQVMFQFFSGPPRGGHAAGPDLSMSQPSKGTALFDLALHLSEDADGLYGQAEYSVDLFDTSTIERMITHFKVLLGDALRNPDWPLSRLQLLTSTEMRQAVITATGPESAYPSESTLHSLVAEQARLVPERIAVAFGPERLTYQELDRQANRLARYLLTVRRHGSADGTEWCVAVCLPRSIRQTVCVLGVLKAGARYIPLDPEYPPERLRLMADAAADGFILIDETLPDYFSECRGRVVSIGRVWNAIEHESDEPLEGAHPDSIAYVIHTSGTTGVPKRVGMTHRAIVNLVYATATAPPPGIVLQFASPSFDVSIQEIMSAWCHGATLVLVEESARRDPAATWKVVADHHVEQLFVPVVALQLLAEVIHERPQLSLPLRGVVVSGEQLKISPAIVDLFERLACSTLENQYGPSETHVVAAHRLSAVPATWPTLPPLGRPIANTRVYVLDSEMNSVPPGVSGEIYVAGVALARGYLGSPAPTAERFLPDPFVGAGTRMYRTGDLGRYRADGTLDFLGRADRQLKIRGFRVEPAEIEHVLRQHPLVRHAAVVARDDAGIRRLVAYVVPHLSSPAAAERGQGDTAKAMGQRLRRFLQEKLPAHLIPAGWAFLDRLPTTPSGKLAPDALPPPDFTAAARGAVDEDAGAGTPLERAVVDIWARTLGTDRVGIHEDFFTDLGGHSLLATRVVSLVRDAWGIDLPLSDVFEYPTAAQLARRIEAMMTPTSR